MTNMILSLHKCIQSLTKKPVKKELNNNVQKIDTRQFKDYFAHLKDMGYNISYSTRSINMSKSSFLEFDTDGIKDELIPILIMIKEKYKVNISVIGDFTGIEKKLNFNKFIKGQEYQNNIMVLVLELQTKNEIFTKIINKLKIIKI